MAEIIFPTLEQIGTLIAIVTGIASTIILGYILFTERAALKHEALSRWEDSYQKHSELIGHLIFQGWNKGSGILASCKYENGRLVYHEPGEPEQAYLDQARQHFEEGYPKIWDLYLEAKAYSTKISVEIKQVVASFERDVTSEMEKSCPELARTDQWSSPYLPKFYLDYGLFSGVFSGAFERSRGRFSGTFEIHNAEPEITGEGGIRTKRSLKGLTFSGSGIGRGEPVDIEKLQQVVERLISSVTIQNLMKEYFKLTQKLEKNEIADRLDREIRNVWGRVGAGQPLKGSCDLCPPKPA